MSVGKLTVGSSALPNQPLPGIDSLRVIGLAVESPLSGSLACRELLA